ncbi:MAG: RNA polymerase sigma factor [Gammaproteobacteria bacterium]|nr:MAG: RNA polymerase sigma factor [Gammaproteobacteria bacterium]
MLPSMTRNTDDKVLMVRYRQGEVVAFESLYARHKGPLYRYFLRQGFGTESSAELMQEVWMKIIRAKDRYEPTAKFTTYLYQLAHNCLVDQYRRSAHKLAQKMDDADIDVAQLPATTANPEADALRNESTQQFRAALANLPDEQREAFILKQEAELSLADVAYVTGVSTETAKSRLRYAFSKLRQQLAENESSS